MTEHRIIPVPGAETRKSSVERALEGFDLSKIGGIARPGAVPAAAPRQVVQAPAEPVVEVPLVQDRATEAPVHAPAPMREASVSGSAHASLPPAREPVRFSNMRHAIDRKLLRAQGMIEPEGSVSGLQEEFRIIKRQLLLQSGELVRASRKAGGNGAAGQRVLICSPLPGEGKTYCAVNLALAIAAEKESEVVLVDADFAKPSVLSTLGLPGGPGLMDALTDPAIDVAQCVIGTDVPGLWVLPAGNATNSDTEFLASSRTLAVLERLTEGAPHRIVIFDSPPALAASPAGELARYVGQAVVIVRADRTGQGALEDAISLMAACPNIYLLLNAVHFSPSGRRFGSYYGYGG